MDFIRILEMFFAIGIIFLVIKFINNKGISIGSYKKNYSLKLFLVLMLMGILIRINFLFSEFEYKFKDTVETIAGIIIIYVIMAFLNRNGNLDKPNINDFVGALLIVGGIMTLIAIMLI